MGGEDMLESNALLALLGYCGAEEELRHMCERIAPRLADRDERAQLVRRFSMLLKHALFVRENTTKAGAQRARASRARASRVKARMA